MNCVGTRSVVAYVWVLIEAERLVEEGKTIKICVSKCHSTFKHATVRVTSHNLRGS
jgi:hypothetical protein